MGSYYLVELDDNYADEFDVVAFEVLTKKEYLEAKAQTQKVLDKFFAVEEFTEEKFNKVLSSKYSKEVYDRDKGKYVELTYDLYKKDPKKWNSSLVDKTYERYFGTNEQLQWRSPEQYWHAIKETVISKQEYDTLNKLFGGSYGIISNWFPLEGGYDEEEDD